MLRINNVRPAVYFTSNYCVKNSNNDTKIEQSPNKRKDDPDKEFRLSWQSIEHYFYNYDKIYDGQEDFMNEVEDGITEPVDITKYKNWKERLWDELGFDPEDWQRITSDEPNEVKLGYFSAQASRLEDKHERLEKRIEHYERERRANYRNEICCLGEWNFNEANRLKDEVRYYTNGIKATEAELEINEVAQACLPKFHEAYEQYVKTGKAESIENLLRDKNMRLLKAAMQE